MRTVLPRLKRCLGKSVTTWHLSSPRSPCAASTCAMTRNSGAAALDDVEVDSGAFARCGGFDEGSETADDSSLAANDFADVFFVHFQLVNGGVSVLDFLHLDGFRFGDEGFGDVFDHALPIGPALLD